MLRTKHHAPHCEKTDNQCTLDGRCVYEAKTPLNRGDIFEAFVGPFLKLSQWVLDNPDSKRLPKGFKVADRSDRSRRGLNSLDVFVTNWNGLQANYPGLLKLVTKEENAVIDKIYAEFYRRQESV